MSSLFEACVYKIPEMCSLYRLTPAYFYPACTCVCGCRLSACLECVCVYVCVCVFVACVCERFKRTYYCSVSAPGTDVWFCKYRCKSLFRKPRRVMKTFLRFCNCVMPKVFHNSCEDSSGGSCSCSSSAALQQDVRSSPSLILPLLKRGMRR